MTNSYYKDKKYCDECGKYVSYLMSVDLSYCVECGGEVKLFSQGDWQNFNDKLSERRTKGGRPRKERKNKESA